MNYALVALSAWRASASLGTSQVYLSNWVRSLHMHVVVSPFSRATAGALVGQAVLPTKIAWVTEIASPRVEIAEWGQVALVTRAFWLGAT